MPDNKNGKDLDPIETREWLDSIDSLLEEEGVARCEYVLRELIAHVRSQGSSFTDSFVTPYKNTIGLDKQPAYPGDKDIERRISALLRWNSVVMVLRAGRKSPELGGHIASYASSAYIYEVGFNHFFHAKTDQHGGDLLYIQGHTSPGIYARAFLEGRLSESQLDGFRQEVENDGLSSYPHPWLMPDFWQFPTVSMGLGPISAIYQARFMKYLHNRELTDTKERNVWCFCGDGEMDEPESLGAISLAGREKLNNLKFVINCNLQRLDGPVRGNSKIIQELEAVFQGAGWKVIKVIWGSAWDDLFAKDTSGKLQQRMEECVDGDYQNYKAHSGAYTREHFFNKYPETKELVKDLSDEEIWRLNRGGHDVEKIFAAYSQAANNKDQPTVILVKTVKGYGMGTAGEAQNKTHQQKKMDKQQLMAFRDRFSIPVTDAEIDDLPFYRPKADSPEIKYLLKQRQDLGGFLPARKFTKPVLPIPALDDFKALLAASGERKISTTMAFVRILNILVKNKELKKHIVPIIPDEARTFGMEGMFRQLGIYSSVGQLYQPVDSDEIMYYKEDKKGQILEEGITEAGGFCSWLAAATSYSIHDKPMIPFFIYYSMFGFQRIGDLAWLAGDAGARGFLLGATAGRTTLAGEGLQHQDGHSHIISATIPNCVSYDPTYAYELAVIIQHGLQRMYVDNENVYFYLTVMNENYEHPAMPEGVEEEIIKGMYFLSKSKSKHKNTVTLLGSGTILLEVLKAKEILEAEYSVNVDVYSVTSFTELRREALSVKRANTLHPSAKQKQAFVSQKLAKAKGPIVAATDYMQSYAEQIREFVPGDYHVLGTDGFGRSDTRKKLRHFFEVDAKFITVHALNALLKQGKVKANVVEAAIKKFNINPDKPDPVSI